MEPHFLEVNVAWSKDRKGILCSPELNAPSENGCIEVATPPNFPKGIPGIWSPEHLFTAAVSSCGLVNQSSVLLLHFYHRFKRNHIVLGITLSDLSPRQESWTRSSIWDCGQQ